MKTVKVEMEMPEIEGYEYTGEFRCPVIGEVFASNCGIGVAEFDFVHEKWHILRKKKPERWRAKDEEAYWMVGEELDVVRVVEGGYEVDRTIFEIGNYFKTEKQAEEAARRVKATLLAYQEELLEERK